MSRKILLVRAKKSSKIIIDELKALMKIIGYELEGEVYVKGYSSKAYISDAKMEEIEVLVKNNGIDTILVEPRVEPHILVHIQRRTGCKVIDRVLLLLEVFEKHAGSREAKLQIELARLQHTLPIYREIVNQCKKGELPGFLAGGRYAVDWYYRHVKKKIAKIRRELEELREKRAMLRAGRRRRCNIPMVSIVGFSNAGKTTLFNALTGFKKPVAPELFTTLYPKVGVEKTSRSFMLIDTVGFVMNVPPEIIEAFYSTLEEIVESDLIVLVLDASEDVELIKTRLREAYNILCKINAINKPIVIAMNKIDYMCVFEADHKKSVVTSEAANLMPNLAGTVCISALKRIGLNELVDMICRILSQKYMSLGLVIGPKGIKE